jgi:hypothetical protein
MLQFVSGLALGVALGLACGGRVRPCLPRRFRPSCPGTAPPHPQTRPSLSRQPCCWCKHPQTPGTPGNPPRPSHPQAGGKNGVIAPDQTTFDYVKARTSEPFEPVYTDAGASFIDDYRWGAWPAGVMCVLGRRRALLTGVGPLKLP